MAELDYNAVGALTDVRRFEWDDTDELYNLIAQSQYQYNARNQITSIAHNNAAGNSIVSHGYLYNADGDITQYTNSLDGSVLYDYDFLGQLIGADYSNLNIPDESYQYDLNGNRELVTNANGDLVVYSTGTNNELTSDGAYTYAYDAEGNRISKTNATGTERELYVWDYRNRLSSVTKQEYNATTQEWQTVQIVEYAYDYNNVLIRKVLDADGDGISDSKTIFLPENYQTAIQLDDADLSDSTDATVSHRYLWTPGQQDKLLADVTPTETLWTLTDHLGTIRDMIQNTPSGLLVPAHVIYDAYGNVLSCKDANGTDIDNPVLFGFTGKYFDADTQLQNNINRWYDSIIGRWLSTDPIGFNGNDTNLYRYVGNSSNTFTDIYGLDIKDYFYSNAEERNKIINKILNDEDRFPIGNNDSKCGCVKIRIIIELPDATFSTNSVGHTGIGIGKLGEYYDYGPDYYHIPQNLVELLKAEPVDGSRFWDYPNYKMDRDFYNFLSGVKKKDKTEIVYFSISVTKKEAEKIEKYWKELYRQIDEFDESNRPKYSFLGKHCTSTVLCSMLGNTPEHYAFYSPATLFAYIANKSDSRFFHTCGENKGKPVKMYVIEER